MDSSDSSGDDAKPQEQFASSSANDIDLFMNNLDLSGIDFIRKANSSQGGSQKSLRGPLTAGSASSSDPDPQLSKFNEYQYAAPFVPHDRSTPSELRDWSAPRVPSSSAPYYPDPSGNIRGVVDRQGGFPSLDGMANALPSQRHLQQSPSMPMSGERRPSYGSTGYMSGGEDSPNYNPYAPSHMMSQSSAASNAGNAGHPRTQSPGWLQQQQLQQLQQHGMYQQHQQRDVDYNLGVSFDQMSLRGADPSGDAQVQSRYPPRYPTVPQQQQPHMMPQMMSPPSYMNMHQQQQYQVQQPPYHRPVLQMPQPPQLITRSPPRQQTFRQQTHPEVFPSANDIIYQVQFKRTFLYFVYYAESGQAFEPGDFVITECDRGEDLGMVVNIINLQIYHEHKHQDIKFLDEEVFRIRQIIRLATRLEREQLPIKYHDEQTVLQHCIEVVRNVFMLPMNVIDAEYQYDRTKLSIYYVSDVRIDFREIVRHVFSTFQTRIWMKKSNRELSFEPVAYAVAALASGIPPNKATLYRGDLGRGVGTPQDISSSSSTTSGGGHFSSVSVGGNSPFINNGGGY